MIIINLTDKILEYGNKHKERIIGRYSISELWGLITINYFTGKPYTSIQEWLNGQNKPFDDCLKMWKGSWKHKQIQDLMKNDGYEIEKKIEKQFEDFTLVGIADFLKGDTILEIKTSDHLINEAKRWHIWQIKMYLSMFNVEKGIILQPIVKNGLFLKNIGEVKKNDVWFKKQLLLISNLHLQCQNQINGNGNASNTKQ